MQARWGMSLLALALWGCGGAGSGAPAGSAAPAATAAHLPGGGAPRRAVEPAGWVVGRVAQAPAEAEALLFRRDEAARTLRALAATYVTGDLLERDGRFALRLEGPLARASGPLALLISAPGRALCWVDPAALGEGPIVLVPEARLTLRVLDALGQPVAAAVALAFDAEGLPLPLPPLDGVSDARGELRLTRLPAGPLEVVLLAPDGEGAGRLAVEVAAGEALERTVTLGADPVARLRFLRAAGEPLGELLAGEEAAR